MAKLFDQTPMINVNSRDVIVQVPMIYAEDIARYESHLKTRVDRNTEIAKDWTALTQSML